MTLPILELVPESFESDRLWIRCPRPGDGAAVNQAIVESFDVLRQWLPWATHVPTAEESEVRIRQSHANYLTRTDLPMFFFLKSSGEFIGGGGLHRMNWAARLFEIGYWCRTSKQGQGYVTEAVKAITRMAFDELRANRVSIHCSHRNVASARVAERAGFKHEATLQDAGIEPNGELRDTLVFALTRRTFSKKTMS